MSFRPRLLPAVVALSGIAFLAGARARAQGSAQATPVLSEFMASNNSTIADQDGDFADWLEIYNPDPSPQDIGGYYLTDKAKNPTKWKIPSVTVPAQGSVVIFCSQKNYTDPTQPLATSFNLSSSASYVALVKPDGKTVATSYSYPIQYPDVSYGITQPELPSGLAPAEPDEQPQVGYFEAATPGSPNGTAANLLLADMATISTPPGIFAGSVSVTLGGAGAGEHIRYVLAPGSASGDSVAPPTASSPMYTGTLMITSTALLKAAVFSSDDSQRGLPATAMYVQLDNTTANRLDTFSSNLPLVVFDDHGYGLLPDDDAYHPGWIGAFSPVQGVSTLTQAPDFFTPDAMKLHGFSSAGAPKQSYDADLADTLGNDLDQPFLGLDDEKSWVSIAGWYYDRTYIHNAFVYSLAKSMGHWAARTKFAEIFIHSAGGVLDSGSYAGITSITDRIKVDTGRVNIYSLQVNDTTAPNVTGGYILRIDHPESDLYGWTTSSGVALMLDTPKRDVLVQPQIAYITNYVQAMEFALYGDLNSGWATRNYLSYLDRPSWVDYHILNTFVKNVDAFQFSEYFSKDVDGPVVAGPVWDYDRSMGSADGRDVNPETWSPGGFSVWDVGWWSILVQDPDFVQAWIDRWQSMRGSLFSTASLNSLINSLAAQIGPDAAARDAARWPDDAGRWGGGWAGEMAYMGTWVTSRALWIDQQFAPAPLVSVSGATRTLTPVNGAEIAYTLDGSDPRLSGGGISPAALVSGGAVSLPAGQAYVARCYNAGFLGRPIPASPWSSPVGGADRLANVSCLATVGGPLGILTEGFVVSGPAISQEQVLLRAVGPGLSLFGLSSTALARPLLNVFDATGALVASNSGWSASDNAANIQNAATVAGAFALPAGSADAALLINLLPGDYTLQVSGADQGQGQVLAEVYEIGSSGSRVINLSSSGVVGAGGTLTNGLFVSGTARQQVLVRGDGPSLALFGVASPLSQPVLQVFDSNGNLIATNSGWQNNANAAQVAAAAAAVGAFALPASSADSALLLALDPGAYTVVMTGANGSSGAALAETYSVP